MKKILATLLSVCSLVLAGAAVGCDEEESSSTTTDSVISSMEDASIADSSSLKTSESIITSSSETESSVTSDTTSSESENESTASTSSSLTSSTSTTASSSETSSISSMISSSDESESESSEDSSSSYLPDGVAFVTFPSGEGYSIAKNNTFDGFIDQGATLTFEIDLGAFYLNNEHTMAVYVNDHRIVPNAEGVYNYVVDEQNLNVRVEGVVRDRSNMAGSGTMEDAFVVSKPIDLLYIAEQVNKGNTTYSRGAYVLANDIDCQGEQLEIIGDYSTQNAIFSGSFACVSDPDTGAFERHTISNFTINSHDSGYVGLFGAVFADMSLESTAFFYGICLDNFTIEMGVSGIMDENKTVTCGSLVGFGVGATVILCDATNGTINVNADGNYFSYVGGLVGYQQAFYDSTYGMSFPFKVTYATVGVDINIISGVALYAGGITGYTFTNTAYGAAASIYNSYSTGNINGALRSGGIAGGLGQYTAISNCYALGDISAKSMQNKDSALANSDEYCYAYAGGIVGYAENDTVAHDCFFNGTTASSAMAGKAYERTHSAIAGGAKAGDVSVDSKQYVTINCLDGINLADKNAVPSLLGWNAVDWIFKAQQAPVINYETPDVGFTLSLTVNYVDPTTGKDVTVGDQTSWTEKFFDTSISSMNSYNPIGSFVMSDNALPVLAQTYTASNGYRSYGFFFDKECTQPVPYSYIPMKNITLYVGFASLEEVVGTYYILTEYNTNPLIITLDSDGIATYSDGMTELNALYTYDGTHILLQGARLARYFNGDIIIDEDLEDTSVWADPNFDLYRYGFYNFKGMVEDGVLKLFDNEFFTESKPLTSQKDILRGEFYQKTADSVIYYSFYGNSALVDIVPNADDQAIQSFEYDVITINGENVVLSHSNNAYAQMNLQKSELLSYDAFKGSWTKSATVDKIYTFDGTGNWTYVYYAHDRASNGYNPYKVEQASGTYELSSDGLTLIFTGTPNSATFDSDGHLSVVNGIFTETYYAENSYVGTWRGSNYELELYGILSSNGLGKALLTTDDGYTTDLYYETSETQGILAFYYPLLNNAGLPTAMKDLLFGYANYNARTNLLQFVLPNELSASGYGADMLRLYDDFRGEWISDHEAFANLELSFNGLGLYANYGELTITEINGSNRTKTSYVINGDADGVYCTFSYKGVSYDVTLDENTGIIHISNGDSSIERKDELAGIAFVDLNGTTYDFDGRSTLGEGKFTTSKGASYTYKAVAGGFDVYSEGTKVGIIQKKATHYFLTINEQSEELYIENKFMGDWAVSGAYALFQIGPTDLTGLIHANFKGSDVTLSFIDPVTLKFSYKENNMPYTYYVFVEIDPTTNEEILVLSEFTNLLGGDYIICSKANEFFGVWGLNSEYNEATGESKTTLKFDGVTSGYANGQAVRTLQLNHVSVTTEYYYMIRKGGVIMWSRDLMQGRTWYFALEIVDLTKEPEAVNDANAFVLRDADGNPLKVLRLSTVDGLYLTNATDESGAEYIFDGKGNLLINGSIKYTYKIVEYHSNNTVSLLVTDVETKKIYNATLDYRDSENMLFTLGEPVTEEV